jgi:ADP-dependent phosphofructokinase/glucokinase
MMAGMSKAIVLGLGDNIDYEIRWDSSIIEGMIREYGITDKELNIHSEIRTERELLVSILGFLKAGVGGERFVHDIAINEACALRFEKKITLGGTAVRAAIVMRKLGYTSAVHLVTMNAHVTRLLPPDCEILCSNDKVSSYPHLIVQFGPGTRVHANDIHIETKRANRIIYTNDEDNALMRLHPELASLLTDAKVFLICGFNAMNDEALLLDRLCFLEGVLEKTVGTLFFEDACYHHPALSGVVRAHLVRYIDIYSLNEDELMAYVGHSVNLTDAESVLAALKELHTLIPVPVLVVHTRFWALAWGVEAGKYEKALLGGVTMATTRFRLGDDFTRADYEETSRLPLEEEGLIFAREIRKLAGSAVACVSSYLVTEKNVTTVGLGDTFVGGFLPALAQ